MISYLEYVFVFLNKLLSLQIINGVTLYTIFFYNMFLISFWVVFTRRS